MTRIELPQPGIVLVFALAMNMPAAVTDMLPEIGSDGPKSCSRPKWVRQKLDILRQEQTSEVALKNQEFTVRLRLSRHKVEQTFSETTASTAIMVKECLRLDSVIASLEMSYFCVSSSKANRLTEIIMFSI